MTAAKVEYLDRALRVARAERDEAKARIEALEKAYKELRLEAEVQLIMLACAGVEKLTEIEPDAGWDSGETVAAMYISQLPALQDSSK